MKPSFVSYKVDSPDFKYFLSFFELQQNGGKMLLFLHLFFFLLHSSTWSWVELSDLAFCRQRKKQKMIFFVFSPLLKNMQSCRQLRIEAKGREATKKKDFLRRQKRGKTAPHSLSSSPLYVNKGMPQLKIPNSVTCKFFFLPSSTSQGLINRGFRNSDGDTGRVPSRTKDIFLSGSLLLLFLFI